jgi:large subunit ribosomal protein L24
MTVKKGDMVVVISGAFKSKQAHEVLKVNRKNQTVLVKDVNIMLKNIKKSQEAPKGGQIRKEFPLHISKVALYDEGEKRGVRLRHEGTGRGKTRVSVRSGKTLGVSK